jgi:hypothetical protein
MSAKHKLEMHKKAKGGKVNEYNAVGSPEVKEAKNEEAGFKKGGKMKKGGHADGAKSHHRLDKAKRGGKIGKHAAGGSPFTAAAHRTPYSNSGDGEGHDRVGGTKMDKKSQDPKAGEGP